MASEANNDLKYTNLVTRVMNSCLRQDDEEIFRYPADVTAARLSDANRTMSADRFSDFMDYMKKEHPVDYHALEIMFRKGYRWKDPVSSDFGGNILRKLAYGPEYVLRYYRDHEFQRTGDFDYASTSMRKIGTVTLVCSLMFGLFNPFFLALALWQLGASAVSAEKLIAAPMTGNDDFPKLVRNYFRIHNKTRFFILNEIQRYVLNGIDSE